MNLGCLGLAEVRDYAGKCAVKAAFQIAFPNRKDLPTGSAEVARLLSVAGNIAVKFFPPKCRVVLWERILAFRAAVPEAAINKYCEPSRNECDIGTAGDAFVVQAVTAKALPPESLAQQDLGAGIFAAVGAHHTRYGLALGSRRSFVANIGHR